MTLVLQKKPTFHLLSDDVPDETDGGTRTLVTDSVTSSSSAGCSQCKHYKN